MSYLFYSLLYGYGGLMSVAAGVSFYQKQTPLWAMLLTFLGAFLLFFALQKAIFLYLGLLLLVISALVNGTILNGSPNMIHAFIRVLFSIGLIFLYKKM